MAKFSNLMTGPLGLILLLACQPVTLMASDKSKIPPQVVSALKQANVPLNNVSILITPLAAESQSTTLTPKPRLSHRATAEMNPASVMKLITTSAGLSILGADFTWRNRIWVDGPVVDGVLQGNLYVKGSGDPKLVLERLQSLLQDIMSKGIKEVRGDIILDGSVFDLPPKSPASFDDEPLRPYNVAPQGLLLNFNAMLFKFSPDPALGIAKIEGEPPLANVQWPATVALAAGPCQDWRTQLRADFSQAESVRFQGAYTSNCPMTKSAAWWITWCTPPASCSRCCWRRNATTHWA